MMRQTLRRAARLVDTALASSLDRRFSSRLAPDPQGLTMLLSPHLDDAVINCWSVLVSDADVRVVNVCTKMPSPGVATPYDLICGARDSAIHMRERIREDADALALAGRAPTNMSFLDVQYRRRRPSLFELDAALARVARGAAALYAPAGLGFDPHPDHALVRRLALRVAQNGIPVRLYADVPYAVSFGWPHWVTDSPQDDHLDIDAYWRRLLRDVQAIGDLRDAQVVRLSEADAKRKLDAMRTYRTQFAALDGGSVGLLRNPLIHGFEVFWDVPANSHRVASCSTNARSRSPNRRSENDSA